MPLEKGAKPGSEGFKKNIETEIAAGKPQKQAVAIAYREARADMADAKFKKLTDLLDEFFAEEAAEPEHKNDDMINGNAALIDAINDVAGRAIVAGAAKKDAEERKRFTVVGTTSRGVPEQLTIWAKDAEQARYFAELQGCTNVRKVTPS